MILEHGDVGRRKRLPLNRSRAGGSACPTTASVGDWGRRGGPMILVGQALSPANVESGPGMPGPYNGPIWIRRGRARPARNCL